MNDRSATVTPGGRWQETWLYAAFLVSGFAALLYQIVWQRALYAIYGINIESVTVVVTAFMIGLGVGSLAGGLLARHPGRPALLLFGAIELGIGAFGALSLRLFRWIGALTLGLSFAGTTTVTLLVVLLPTLLMGATLPLLTGHLVRRSHNVGRSLGRLYFVNTLGSALAALVGAVALLGALGQQRAVWLAAALNLLAGGAAIAAHLAALRSPA